MSGRTPCAYCGRPDDRAALEEECRGCGAVPPLPPMTTIRYITGAGVREKQIPAKYLTVAQSCSVRIDP